MNGPDRMNINVISLYKTPERLEAFRIANDTLDYDLFYAIDGATVDEKTIRDIHAGTVNYSHGTLGCYLSHIALWEKAIKLNETLTICEDDAVFHSQFSRYAKELIAKIDGDWDFIAWGWNMDSVLHCRLLPGLSPVAMIFDQDEMRNNTETFIHTSVEASLFPLYRACGTPCYTISPQGAKKFLTALRPLFAFEVYFPILNRKLKNTGIDIMMNTLYSETMSMVSFPPLVLTKNQHEISTIQNTAAS
jgi:GR25 family glycosyltransferase involved in LPS biosynthesis